MLKYKYTPRDAHALKTSAPRGRRAHLEHLHTHTHRETHCRAKYLCVDGCDAYFMMPGIYWSVHRIWNTNTQKRTNTHKTRMPTHAQEAHIEANAPHLKPQPQQRHVSITCVRSTLCVIYLAGVDAALTKILPLLTHSENSLSWNIVPICSNSQCSIDRCSSGHFLTSN